MWFLLFAVTMKVVIGCDLWVFLCLFSSISIWMRRGFWFLFLFLFLFCFFSFFLRKFWFWFLHVFLWCCTFGFSFVWTMKTKPMFEGKVLLVSLLTRCGIRCWFGLGEVVSWLLIFLFYFIFLCRTCVFIVGLIVCYIFNWPLVSNSGFRQNPEDDSAFVRSTCLMN